METKTTCYIHSDRETTLRCNRCERPICTECAVLTPTGYRCKNCVKAQQKVFETTFNNAKPLDLFLGPLTAFILTALGSLASLQCQFYILFIAPAFGWLFAEAVRRVVSKRRSYLLFRLVGLGFILGSLVLPAILFLLTGLQGIPVLIWPLVYGALVTVSGYSNIYIGKKIKV